MTEYYIQYGLSWGGFTDGKVWQLLTYSVLHASWLHLLVNLVLFVFLVLIAIPKWGFKNSVVIFLLGVLSGGFFHIVTVGLAVSKGYEDQHLVGLSGGCYALLLALLAMSPYSKVWKLPLSRGNLAAGICLTELVFLLMHPGFALPLFSSMSEILIQCGAGDLLRISHSCHLGGGVAGLLLGRFFSRS